MKLSKKGIEKISRNCKNVMVIGTDDFFPPTILEGSENLEFDQSDFTEAVVLTVEEANFLFKVIDGFFDLRLPTTKEIVALNKLKVRVERIEQAESK